LLFISGSSRAECFKVITEDANYRVGYFRTEFVGYVLNLMMKGARYESICQGLRDPDLFSDNTADTGEGKMFTEPFREMHKALKAAEDEMYDAVPGTSWGLTLTSDDQYKDLKPRQLYKALKDEFFPDYKYYIIEHTTTINSDAVARFDSGIKWKPYGSIMVGQKIVFYITRDFTGTTLSSLSSWKNKWNGRETTMCNWYDIIWFECTKATTQIVNTRTHNSPLFVEYQERGVVLLRTEYEFSNCYRRKRRYCVARRWQSRSNPKKVGDRFGDPIYQQFTTEWETTWDSMYKGEGRFSRKTENSFKDVDGRAKYTVVGLGKPLNCLDKKVNCAYLASVDECEKNPAYMNHYCPKSCGTCF